MEYRVALQWTWQILQVVRQDLQHNKKIGLDFIVLSPKCKFTNISQRSEQWNYDGGKKIISLMKVTWSSHFIQQVRQHASFVFVVFAVRPEII